jgi:uncharacterized membrane protein
MKTVFVISLAVIAQAVGNTLLSKGMKVIASMPSFSDGFSLVMLAYALKNPLIWGGIVLLIVFFASFLSALSWADLSYVLPATAPGYILNVFFGGWFLGEPVSQARWVGSALIFIGVMLVSLSGARKEKLQKLESENAQAAWERASCSQS